MSDAPISVPVDEPTEEQKARWAEDAKKSELITEVINELRTETEWMWGKVQQVNREATQNELVVLSNQFADLAAKCDAGAAKLTGAGIGSDVASLRACQNAANHARCAAQDAGEAAAYAPDNEAGVHNKMESVRSQMACVSVAIKEA